MKRTPFRSLLLIGLLAALPSPSPAYSVLTHEEVVDMAWVQHSVPLLKKRFPAITPNQLREAHAYAYGGCVIQDLGYYPSGRKLFSDLLHYVRTGDFVEALLRDASTPDELAFALGALAHYTSDSVGHPYVNKVTAMEFPKLRAKYGPVVTYEEDKTDHLRTEFGFDVVGVARGKYAQEDYRHFIGFEVAKPLLNRAFEETYGLKIEDVLRNEDKSIGSARWAVSILIPKMTKVALLSFHGEIQKANPGGDLSKFRYRINRTSYEKNWGKNYTRPGFGSHLIATLIAILPKVGPLKALKLKLPNADEQVLYLRSVNETVDQYDAEIDVLQKQAVPSAIPAAESNGKRPDADTTQAAPEAPAVAETIASGVTMRLQLPPINLDTGKPISPGEYRLSDETHATLIDRVVKTNATLPDDLRQHLADFYTGPNASKNSLQKNKKKWARVQADLAILHNLPLSGPTLPAPVPTSALIPTPIPPAPIPTPIPTRSPGPKQGARPAK